MTNFSRRDFLKVAGIGIGAMAFNPFDPELPGLTAFSEIFKNSPYSTQFKFIATETTAIDPFSTTCKILPSIKFPESNEITDILTAKVLSRIDLTSFSKGSNLFIDHISENQVPRSSKDQPPDSEIAKITISDGPTYLCYSPFPSQLEVVDASEFVPDGIPVENCVVDIHKNGVVSVKSASRGQITSNVFLYRGFAFSKVFSTTDAGEMHEFMPDLIDPRLRSSAIANKNITTKPRILVTSDNQVGILTHENTMQPVLELLSSTAPHTYELPNLIRGSIFSLGPNLSFLSSENDRISLHITNTQNHELIYELPIDPEKLQLYMSTGLTLESALSMNFAKTTETDGSNEVGRVLFSSADQKQTSQDQWLIRFIFGGKRLIPEFNHSLASKINSFTRPEYPPPNYSIPESA